MHYCKITISCPCRGSSVRITKETDRLGTGRGDCWRRWKNNTFAILNNTIAALVHKILKKGLFA